MRPSRTLECASLSLSSSDTAGNAHTASCFRLATTGEPLPDFIRSRAVYSEWLFSLGFTRVLRVLPINARSGDQFKAG